MIGKSHRLWKLALGTGYALLIGGFAGWALKSHQGTAAAASQRLPRMIVPHTPFAHSEGFEGEPDYEPFADPIFIAEMPWIQSVESPSPGKNGPEINLAGRDANGLVVAVSGP